MTVSIPKFNLLFNIFMNRVLIYKSWFSGLLHHVMRWLDIKVSEDHEIYLHRRENFKSHIFDALALLPNILPLTHFRRLY
jgi:hypothetical protein